MPRYNASADDPSIAITYRLKHLEVVDKREYMPQESWKPFAVVKDDRGPRRAKILEVLAVRVACQFDALS